MTDSARDLIPARARPFVRLGIVVLIVIVADWATSRLIHHGGTFGFPTVTAVRLASSLTILRYPLAGFVFSLEVDKWDWFWLGMGGQPDDRQEMYQYWDKSVDLICLGVAAVMVLRWPDWRARRLALGLYAWRACGVLAVLATGQRWLLIAFPNVFESLYLTYLIFRVLSGHQQMLGSRWAAGLLTVALLIPKATVEVFLHALNSRPWLEMQVLPAGFRGLEPWLWGAALYVFPLAALLVLMGTARDRATPGDPEAQIGVGG